MSGEKIKDVEDNEKGIAFTIPKMKLQEIGSKISNITAKVRDPGFLIDATFGGRFLFRLALHSRHTEVQLTLRNLLKVAVSLDCSVVVVGPMGNTEVVFRQELGPDALLERQGVDQKMMQSCQVSVGVPDLFCGTVGDVQVAVRVRTCEVVKTHALGRMRARLEDRRKEKDAKEAQEAQVTQVTEEKTSWSLAQALEDLGEEGSPKGKETKSEKKKRKQEKKDKKIAEQVGKLKINVDQEKAEKSGQGKEELISKVMRNDLGEQVMGGRLVEDKWKVVAEKPRRREEAAPQALGAAPRALPAVVARLASQLGAAGASASQQGAGSAPSSQPGAAGGPASRSAAPSKAQRKVEKLVRLLEVRQQLAHLSTPSLHHLATRVSKRVIFKGGWCCRKDNNHCI